MAADVLVSNRYRKSITLVHGQLLCFRWFTARYIVNYYGSRPVTLFTGVVTYDGSRLVTLSITMVHGPLLCF